MNLELWCIFIFMFFIVFTFGYIMFPRSIPVEQEKDITPDELESLQNKVESLPEKDRQEVMICLNVIKNNKSISSQIKKDLAIRIMKTRVGER